MELKFNREILNEFNQIKTTQILKRIFISVFVFSISTLFYLTQIKILMLFSWLICGIGIFSLSVLAHDCGHQSLFRTKNYNFIMGVIFSSPTFYPFTSVMYFHERHHKYLNHIEKDIAWRPIDFNKFQHMNGLLKLAHILSRGVFFWISPIAHILFMHLNPFTLPKELRIKFYISVLGVVVWVLLLKFLNIYSYIGFYHFILPSYFVYLVTLSSITLLQHTKKSSPYDEYPKWHKEDKITFEDHFLNTIDIKMPILLEESLHFINYHKIHHLYPQIPCYNLKNASVKFFLNSKLNSIQEKISFDSYLELLNHDPKINLDERYVY